jgi:hypothetical protein
MASVTLPPHTCQGIPSYVLGACSPKYLAAILEQPNSILQAVILS